MKITVVFGFQRMGYTYNIAQEVIKNIADAETREVFLPRDLPEFCISFAYESILPEEIS